MRVTLYSAPECGLCREAEAALRRVQKRAGFELEVVDIEQDEAAHRLYWARIPVVLADGREIAAAPIDERVLEKGIEGPGNQRVKG